jgi:tRNA(Ile)-lysidine synthase
MVAAVCKELNVPHSTLAVQWKSKPVSAIQERARHERYRLLGSWAERRGLKAVAAAHHLDDQVETLLMRLNRGAGARGLAGMRPIGPIPGGETSAALIRPLLEWRRSELVDLCSSAGLTPIDDPSNRDEQFERVRMRHGLAGAPWLHGHAIARSARNLADAESALDWATDIEWERQVSQSDASIDYSPLAPWEIRRRIVQRAVATFANEGDSGPLRGRELDRLVTALSEGGKATIRGVLCAGGMTWTFSPAPGRSARRQQ